MKLANPRVVIAEGTTEYNIMHSILKEFSGARRNVMLHSFFVSHLTSLIKHSLSSHVEGTQEYYNVLQYVGTSQGAYQEVFDHSIKEYPNRGLDLVRDFSSILDMEYQTRKLTAIAGLEGFDIHPTVNLDQTYFTDINHLGFGVKVIGAAERAAMNRPGK